MVQVIEDFEGNIDIPWSFGPHTDTDEWNKKDSRSHEGTYSGRLFTYAVDAVCKSVYRSFPYTNPQSVSYWYWESSDNEDAGLGLFDSAGDLVIGAGTDNPQFLWSQNGDMDNRTGREGNLEEWVEVQFEFDWDNDDVTITWTAQNSGTTDQITTGFNGNDIVEVGFGTLKDNYSDIKIDFDYLTYDTGKTPPSTPQNVSGSVSNADIVIDWDPVTWEEPEERKYHIYRTQTSGSVYTEIDTVPEGTTQYTDGDIAAGTYYYKVSASNIAESSKSSEVSQESPIIGALWEGFEDGDIAEWSSTSATLDVSTDTVWSGSYSLDFNSTPDQNNACKLITRSFPVANPRAILYYYKEGSDNNSLGIGIRDSSDNILMAAGTGNPQYEWTQTDGTKTRPGTEAEYGEWVKVRFYFDWNNNEVTVNWTAQSSGTTEQITKSFNGNDIAEIGIGAVDDGSHTEDCHVDHIEYEVEEGDPPSVPQNLTSSFNNDAVDLDWDPVTWYEPDRNYTIYRSTSSGTNKSDYSAVEKLSEGTTSYQDDGVSPVDTFYHRVSATNMGAESDLSNESSETTPIYPKYDPGEIAWEYTHGSSGTSSTVDSEPDIVEDKDLIVFGSRDGYVYALNRSDGSLAWKYQASSNISDSSVIWIEEEDIVTVGSKGDQSIKGINTSDGSLAWEYSLSDKINSGGAYVKHRGIVIYGSEEKKLHALNVSDGSVAWEDNRYGDAIRSDIIYIPDEDIVVFDSANSSSNERVYGINTSDGSVAWEYSISHKVRNKQYTWLRGEDLVLYTQLINDFDNGIIRALDTATGSLVWSNTSDTYWDYHYQAKSETDNIVVVNDLHTKGLNAADGSTLWSNDPNSIASEGQPVTVEHNEYVIYAAKDWDADNETWRLVDYNNGSVINSVNRTDQVFRSIKDKKEGHAVFTGRDKITAVKSNYEPPTKPQLTGVVNSNNNIELDWNVSDWDPENTNNITKKISKVYRSTTSEDLLRDYTEVGSLSSGQTTFTDTNTTEGTTYYYRVTAETNNEVSLMSSELSITTEGPPSTPQNLTGTVNQVEIALDWDAVNWSLNKDHYNIYRAQTSGSSRSDYTDIADVPDGTTTYTDDTTDSSTTYYYRVGAENQHGTSNLSNEISKTTVTIQPPTTPQNLSGSLDASDNPLLDWDAVNWDIDQDHYNVYRSTSSGSTRADYTDIADITAGTTQYTDTSANQDETYYYRVDAENAGGSSSLSSEISIATPGPPSIPGNLSYTQSREPNNQITLDWDAVNWRAYTGHYNVYRSTSSGSTRADYTDIADVQDGTTQYTDSSLNDDQTYYYRVDAINSKGSSDLTYEVASSFTPPGQIGNARLASRRLAWPDWVRAPAIEASGTDTGSVSSSNVVIDAETGAVVATGSISMSISIAIAQSITASASTDAPITQINIVHAADSGGVVADSPLPIIETIHNIEEAESVLDSPVPTIESIQDAKTASATSDSPISMLSTTHGVVESSAEADSSSIPVINTVTDAIAGEGEGTSSISIVTWKAGLGGVVKYPDQSAAQGAEVHIIRDNDDTKVATTTTDANGRWHVTLPGGKSTDSDPPVYSIEVWHREGQKRDPSAKLYNAKNRPFIDTDDPSESTPYDEYYYGDN